MILRIFTIVSINFSPSTTNTRRILPLPWKEKKHTDRLVPYLVRDLEAALGVSITLDPINFNNKHLDDGVLH